MAPHASSRETGPPIPNLIGASPAMEAVYRMARRAARSAASVLLLGETGSGKELIATAIHRLSQRNPGPFVKVNCGALNENLLESELFGHVRGAFTGAVGNRTGRFEAAHTGSIFLDEINSTTPQLQVKLGVQNFRVSLLYLAYCNRKDVRIFFRLSSKLLFSIV